MNDFAYLLARKWLNVARLWWCRLFPRTLSAAKKLYAPLPGFHLVVFRTESKLAQLPTDLPAALGEIIKDARLGLKDGRLLTPLGPAVILGGQIRATITNEYGDIHLVIAVLRQYSFSSPLLSQQPLARLRNEVKKRKE